MRWSGHMAHMGKKSNTIRVLVGKPEQRQHIVRPRHGLDSSTTEYGPLVGSCDHSNDPSGSIKCKTT
jgi:hypothetical protein